MDSTFQSFAIVQSFTLDTTCTVNGISEPGHIITFNSDFLECIIPENAGVESYASIFRVDFTTITEALIAEVNRPPRIIRANQTPVIIDGLPAYSIFVEKWTNSFVLQAGDLVNFEGATVNPAYDTFFACGMTCAQIGSTLIEYEKCFKQLHRDITRLALPLLTACSAVTDSLDIIQQFNFNEWGKITCASSINPWTGLGTGSVGSLDGNTLYIPEITWNDRGLITCATEYSFTFPSPTPGTYGEESTGKVPIIIVNDKGLISSISEYQSSNIPLSTTNISSPVSTIEFTSGIDADGSLYEIRLIDLIPSVNAVNLRMQFSTDEGATWKAGSSDYYYALLYHGVFNAGQYSENDTAHSSMYLTPNNDTGYLSGSSPRLSNSTTLQSINGTIFIYNPYSDSNRKKVTSTINFRVTNDVYNNYEAQAYGNNGYISTTAVNGFKLYMSSGNIAKGKVQLIKHK